MDESLNKGPHFLGLSKRRGDTIVLDELSSQVSEHSFSMFGVTAKLLDVLLVSHFTFVDLKYKTTN